MMDITDRPNWERRTIENLALETLKEQRRARHWRIFFRLLFFAYVGLVIYLVYSGRKDDVAYDSLGRPASAIEESHIALVDLFGEISAKHPANAAQINATLHEAMSNVDVKGVLLLANSPGGSPVQSSLMYKMIMQLKETYQKPIVTVVTDMCASGCYYIASASDEIYADESSIVGSIGVISQSFGYGEAAKKLGIDPRTFTSGKNKDFLNPARPLRPEEITFLEQLLNEMHQNFIDAVKAGRGKKLSNEPDLFSGLFWTGKKAKAFGLIDDIATPDAVVKKMGGYPVYNYHTKDPVERLLEKMGVEAKGAISHGIDQALSSQTGIKFK